MQKIYENIKRLRLSQNMSQQELAEAVGYKGKSMIAKIEKGEVDLPTTKVKCFADALHTDIFALTGMDEVFRNCDTFTVDEYGNYDYVVHADEMEFDIITEIRNIPKENKGKALNFIKMYLESLK